MKYQIVGEPLPVVICDMEAGETMITEKGAMSWMSPNMRMETQGTGGFGKMMGRMFSGESMFQNKYTAEGSAGLIAFASSFPGEIRAIQIAPGQSLRPGSALSVLLIAIKQQRPARLIFLPDQQERIFLPVRAAQGIAQAVPEGTFPDPRQIQDFLRRIILKSEEMFSLQIYSHSFYSFLISQRWPDHPLRFP